MASLLPTRGLPRPRALPFRLNLAAWNERTEAAARLLVCVYGFCVPLGGLLRFSGHRQSLGLTSCCVALLVAIRVPALWAAVRRHRALQWLAALLALLAAGSLFRLLDPRPGAAWTALRSLGGMAFYVALAAAVAGLGWNPRRLRALAAWLAVGLALSSVLTLVDYWGWADLPRFNDHVVGTSTNSQFIRQAHGPFSHRTALAAYLVLALPLLLVLVNRPGLSRATRLLFHAASVAALLVLLMSHSRGAPLAIAAAVGWFHLRRRNLRAFALHGLLPAVAVLLLVLALAPQVLAAYRILAYHGATGVLLPADAERDPRVAAYGYRDDMMRYDMLCAVLGRLPVRPLGEGFGDVYSPSHGWTDPHSVVAGLLLAGGMLALPWLLLFAREYLRTVGRGRGDPDRAVEVAALHAGLAAWCLMAVMHNLLYVSLVWVLLGVLLALSRPARPPAPAPAPAQ